LIEREKIEDEIVFSFSFFGGEVEF